MRMRRLLELLCPGALYLGLTGYVTWPLVAHLGTDLAATARTGAFDTLYTTWALAYETQALTSAPSAFFDANIYYPATRALLYGPAALGALPYFAPVYLATGNPVLAVNAMMLLGLASTAAGIHLVLKALCGSHLAGVLGAVFFLTNRWVLTWIPTSPHYAMLQYLPWIAFLLCRRVVTRGETVALAVLVTLQCLTDPVYVAVPLLVVVGGVGVLRLARRDAPGAGLRVLGAAATAVVVLLPLVGAYLRVRAANPALATQTLWGPGLLDDAMVHPVSVSWRGVAGNDVADL